MLIIKYSQFSVRTASAEPVRVRWRCTKHAKRDGDLQASGRYADARSCSLVLVPFAYAHCTPARFTSPRCFSRLIGQMMTHPFTRRLVSGLLLSPAFTPCSASCSSLLVLLMPIARYLFAQHLRGRLFSHPFAVLLQVNEYQTPRRI